MTSRQIRDTAVLMFAFGATLLCGVVLYLALGYPLGLGHAERHITLDITSEQTSP